MDCAQSEYESFNPHRRLCDEPALQTPDHQWWEKAMGNGMNILREIEEPTNEEIANAIAQELPPFTETELAIAGSIENFDDFDLRPVSSVACVRKRTDVLSKEEFCRRIASTDPKQREIILGIIHRFYSFNDKPLQIFFTGPAGCGKTYTQKLIMEVYNRYNNSMNLSDNAFVACGSTGKAASNLGGLTVHSAFNLSVSRTASGMHQTVLHEYINAFRDIKSDNG